MCTCIATRYIPRSERCGGIFVEICTKRKFSCSRWHWQQNYENWSESKGKCSRKVNRLPKSSAFGKRTVMGWWQIAQCLTDQR